MRHGQRQRLPGVQQPALERVLRAVRRGDREQLERYRSDEADALLKEYRETVDPARQTEIVEELQGIVYDDLPVIGLYYGGIWGLFNDSKFTGWPTEDDPYMIPQNYDSAPLGIFTRLERVKEDDR